MVRENIDNITQHNETELGDNYDNNTSINETKSMGGNDPLDALEAELS